VVAALAAGAALPFTTMIATGRRISSATRPDRRSSSKRLSDESTVRRKGAQFGANLSAHNLHCALKIRGFEGIVLWPPIALDQAAG
jgi:hypothetical protein